MNATNPLLIKQEFMAVLSSTSQNQESIDALLKYFCKVSWWLDNEGLECFEKLKNFMQALPQEMKQRLVPNLINLSENYPKLVLIAEELFNSLGDVIQKNIEIPMIYWTYDDAYTSISKNEYQYRQTYGKTAWAIGESYRRPSQPFDFICYGKVLDMIVKSQSKTLIIAGG